MFLSYGIPLGGCSKCRKFKVGKEVPAPPSLQKPINKKAWKQKIISQTLSTT